MSRSTFSFLPFFCVSSSFFRNVKCLFELEVLCGICPWHLNPVAFLLQQILFGAPLCLSPHEKHHSQAQAISSRGLQLVWDITATGSLLRLYPGSRTCLSFVPWNFYSWPHCLCSHYPVNASDLWLTPSLSVSPPGVRAAPTGWSPGRHFPKGWLQSRISIRLHFCSLQTSQPTTYCLLTHVSPGTGWNKCLLNWQTTE